MKVTRCFEKNVYSRHKIKKKNTIHLTYANAHTYVRLFISNSTKYWMWFTFSISHTQIVRVHDQYRIIKDSWWDAQFIRHHHIKYLHELNPNDRTMNTLKAMNIMKLKLIFLKRDKQRENMKSRTFFAFEFYRVGKYIHELCANAHDIRECQKKSTQRPSETEATKENENGRQTMPCHDKWVK